MKLAAAFSLPPKAATATARAPARAASTHVAPAPAPGAPAKLAPARVPRVTPSVGRLTAAKTYVAARAGTNGFAVIDNRGRLSGYHVHETFVAASVTKDMLLVADLRRIAAAGRSLDSSDKALLEPMIHQSDNRAASAVFSTVGDSGLEDVVQRAGMTDFRLGPDWANDQISPADQARFFRRMDHLLPPAFRHYARGLLKNIAADQSWGVPAIARPRWTVLFKGGWRRTGLRSARQPGSPARAPHRTFTMAVVTDGDPSMGYGIATIEGVTARLVKTA